GRDGAARDLVGELPRDSGAEHTDRHRSGAEAGGDSAERARCRRPAALPEDRAAEPVARAELPAQAELVVGHGLEVRLATRRRFVAEPLLDRVALADSPVSGHALVVGHLLVGAPSVPLGLDLGAVSRLDGDAIDRAELFGARALTLELRELRL